MKQTFTNNLFKASMVAALFFITSSSFAGIITVINNNDSGTGSLRQASIDAISGDTIRFSPSLINFGNSTILLTTGEIDFGNKAITIKGLYTATDTLFISGNNNSRIFSFNTAGKVVLDSLVLINGNATSGSGGAVYYLEGTDTLSVLNSIIKNNTVTGYGGGIMNWATPGCVTVVTNSFFFENNASEGGAIDGRASSATSLVTIIVNNSVVSYNIVTASGGGIYAQGAASKIIVNNSTISGNSANFGGGISSESTITLPTSFASVSVTNCTITANNANNGGGMSCSANQGYSAVTVINSTIYGNSATNSGEGIFSSCNDSSSITVGSSIISENGTGTSGFYNNFPTTISSNGFNIFSDAPNGALGSESINIASSTINLGALANNGGNTQTMLPGSGSIAINMGNPSDMTNAQNRAIFGGIRDIGAAESTFCTSSSSDTAIACNSYTWAVNSMTFTNDTIVSDTLFGANVNGCDSIVTLNLTVFQSTMANQTVAVTNATLCANNIGTTITTGSSETGINYFLRDNANDTIIDGPLSGTGSGLSFNTGALASGMTYNVNAQEVNPVTSTNGLSFDGINDRVSVPNSSLLDFANGTIEMWVKPQPSTDNQTLISMRTTGAPNTRFSIHLNSTGNTIVLWNGSVAQSVAIPNLTNNWHHLALVLTATSMDVYVDGNFQGATTNVLNTGNTGYPLVLGANDGVMASNEWYNGEMDEVRVWNLERTATEISSNYLNCLSGTETGLVAYYNFEDGTGSTTVTDLTSNNFNGTLDVNMDANTSYVANAPITCLSCDLEMTQTVTVTVLPAIDITTTTTTGFNITANQTGATYQWLDCNNNNAIIPSETNATYTATSNGSYAVEITESSCVDTSACVVIATVGINGNSLANQITIYPNPNNGVFTIDINGQQKSVQLTITNVVGKIVYQKTVNTQQTVIYLDNLENGVYFVKMENENQTITKRIIKQ